MFDRPKLRNLTPQEVNALLHDHRIVLIDVREPAEFAAERIHGALNYPLSTFDPADLPADPARPLVFQCGSGMRSTKAFEHCCRAGVGSDAHLAGGIMAWKAAGLPTVSLDPASGRIRDAG